MAYQYTTIGKEPIFIGESEDRCYFCNRSLSGRDCLPLENDSLACLYVCPGDE